MKHKGVVTLPKKYYLYIIYILFIYFLNGQKDQLLIISALYLGFSHLLGPSSNKQSVLNVNVQTNMCFVPG
jgi:hypothetical protein